MTQFYATSFFSAWHFFARTFASPAQGKFLQAVLSGRESTARYCDFLAVCLRKGKEAQEALAEIA